VRNFYDTAVNQIAANRLFAKAGKFKQIAMSRENFCIARSVPDLLVG